jgi:hypothetical protein
MLDDELTHTSRARQFFSRELHHIQHVLQVRGLRRVKINATPVQHQRQRPDEIRAQPDRADKAVFHMQQLRPAALRQRAQIGRGIAAPEDQAVRLLWAQQPGGLCVGHKYRLLCVTRQQRPDIERFPPLEAHADHSGAASLRSFSRVHGHSRLWRYMRQQDRRVFSDIPSHPLADDVVQMLRSSTESGTNAPHRIRRDQIAGFQRLDEIQRAAKLHIALLARLASVSRPYLAPPRPYAPPCTGRPCREARARNCRPGRRHFGRA